MARHTDHTASKRWLISGRVQGVGFRYFVQEKASELGLRGFARNLDDGRVEVFATGTPEELNELGAALHLGPRMADVRHVDERVEPVKDFSGFAVR